MRLYGLLIGLGALSLSACQTVPVVTTYCPPIKTYTKDQEAAVSAEMRSHVRPTAEDGFIVDYGALRGEIRACQSTK